MTSDQPAPAQPPTDPADVLLPDLDIPDEVAIRRAILRGVSRTSIVAASWLVLAALLLTIGWVTIGAFRSDRFGHVALTGIEVAHPEYDIRQRSYANFGTSTMELDVRPVGVIGHHGSITGHARQPVFGRMQLELGQFTQTPILEALHRGRPEKAASLRFLDSLPAGMSASAIVEFDSALNPGSFEAFTAAGVGQGAPTSLFLTPRYAAQPTVTWPTMRPLDEYAAWANQLTSSDDQDLATLSLPAAAALRTLARNLHVYAYVADRASLKELRDLLSNPIIRSVNVAEVGFDPGDQIRPN